MCVSAQQCRRAIWIQEFCIRVPTLYEELNSLTFPDHVRNFSRTKLTCNSYFSLHFSRLLLPYTNSFPSPFYYTCSDYEENNKLSALTLTSSYFALKRTQNIAIFVCNLPKFPDHQQNSLTLPDQINSLTFQVSGNPVSVCLSHSCIVLKQLNISSYFLQHMVAQSLDVITSHARVQVGYINFTIFC